MNNQKLIRGAGGIYRYQKLKNSSHRLWKLLWKPNCASTEIELSNWIAKKPVILNQPRAIFSSRQKYGHGQFGRNWLSPKGGVWVSAAINREGSYEKNTQLYGLALALALVDRIERKGVSVKIKWPNDLLVDGKKLAGILPRLSFRGGELRLFRVGVGLNVFNNVPKQGISLKKISKVQKLDIDFWSSEVLIAIEKSIELLNKRNSLCNKVAEKLWAKKFLDPETYKEWDIKGIDPSGGLIISKGNIEKIWTCYS